MTQLDLLADAIEEIEVPVCRDVLIYGAGARPQGKIANPERFPHLHVPPMPAKVTDERVWLAMLDFAEDARRYNQAGRPILDLSERAGAGSNGPIGGSCPGGGFLSSSSKGVEWRNGTDQFATWPQLLRARQIQRDNEPHVARARDLAEGYRLLDYYGGVYGEGQVAWGKDWTPIPLIRGIAQAIRDLGGDPELVECRTDYMREGIAAS